MYGVQMDILTKIEKPPVGRPLSQFPLSLWSDPIAFSVAKSTWWSLAKIQGNGNLAENQNEEVMKFLAFYDF